MDDWVRVRLGRVGGELVATPLPRGAGVLTSLVRADGLLVVPAGPGGSPRGRARSTSRCCAASARSTARSSPSARTTSCSTSPPPSCAPWIPGVTLASSNVGSLGGLVALRDGLCHVAGSHLLDPASGEYTLPYVDRVLGGQRRRGRPPRPPRPGPHRRPRATRSASAGIDDLARPDVRYVNRQRGAGTRVLLDHELGRRGIAPDAITGYAREEHTHLAVAAADRRRARRRRPRRHGRRARLRPRTSCPSLASPTTSCSPRETLDDPVIAPALGAARAAGLPRRGRGARRLRDRGDGPPDPLS